MLIKIDKNYCDVHTGFNYRIAALLKNNNKIKNGMQRPIFRMTAKIWVKYKKPIVLFQLIYNTDNHLHKYFLLDKNNKFDKKDY